MPRGKGAVFFDAEELEVHALALAPGGGLYVGTSPDGKIYKVDAQRQGHRVLRSARPLHLEPGRRPRRQRLRGHRRQGRHLQDHARRQGRAVLRDQGHARDDAGLRSRGPAARRHRVARARLPHRRRRQAVRPARLAATTRSTRCASTPNGNIYAAARQRPSGRAAPARAPRPEPPQPAPQPTASVSTEITGIAIVADTSVGRRRARSRRRANQGPATGALYRIMPDGAWDLVWESREDSPYDVAFEPSGGILVATGNKGKIYRLSGDPLQPTLVARANAQQVTTLLRRSHGPHALRHLESGQGVPPVAGACRPRHLHVRRARRADGGHVGRDQVAGAWRRPAARVEISTRSGNTRTPDETWSDWSAGLRERGRQPDHQPARALPAVARGASPAPRRLAAADVGHRRLPAAQHASARDVDHHSSRRARCSSGRSRRRPGDRRLRRRHARPPRGAQRSGRRRARRRLAESRPPHVSEGAADLRLARRGRQPRRAELRRARIGAKARRRGSR